MSCRAQDEVDDLARLVNALQSKIRDIEHEVGQLQRLVSSEMARTDELLRQRPRGRLSRLALRRRGHPSSPR